MGSPWDFNMNQTDVPSPLMRAEDAPVLAALREAAAKKPAAKKPAPAKKPSISMAPPAAKVAAPALAMQPEGFVPDADRLKLNNGISMEQGGQSKDTLSFDDALKQISQSVNMIDPKKAQEAFDLIGNLPEMKAQKDGIDDLQKQISMMEGAPPVNDNAWVKPLLALADSQTGSNLMKGYTEPTTAKDHNAMLLKYKDELAKRLGDVTDKKIDAVSKLKGGYDLNQVSQGQKQLAELLDKFNKKDEVKTEQSSGYRPPPKGKGGAAETTYEKALNTTLGKFASGYLTSGGGQSIQSDVNVLRSAAKKLRSGAIDTGYTSGLMAKLGNKFDYKTDLAQLADDIAKTSAKALKATFPGAISDSEREFITNLSFDPKASAKVNAERIERAAAILERSRKNTDAAIDYANKNRSLRGFDMQLDQVSSEDDRVSMISPDGKVGKVPRDQVEKAKQKGYKLKGK